MDGMIWRLVLNFDEALCWLEGARDVTILHRICCSPSTVKAGVIILSSYSRCSLLCAESIVQETCFLATFSKLFITSSCSREQHFGLLQASCRAASVLSHILKDNVQCKERVRTLLSYSLLQFDFPLLRD